MRSPGYPTFLALIYRCFGWSWFAARIGGIVVVSLGLSALVTWVGMRWGYLAAAIVGGTLVADYSIMQAAGLIASESFAILMATITFLLLAFGVNRPSVKIWSVSGGAFALLALTRGNWNLGLLILLVASSICWIPRMGRRLDPIRPRHWLAFFIVCFLVASPWWIRNCVVTADFSPFGTAGANGLVAAYCDEALEDGGNWQPRVYHRHQKAVRSEVDFSQLTVAQREVATGKASVRKAVAWSKENWKQLPRLGLMRLAIHWGFNKSVPTIAQGANLMILLSAVAGFFLVSDRTKYVLLVILVVDSLIVMVTWPHLGRYAIPIRPLIHLGSAVTMSVAIRYFFLRVRPRSKSSSIVVNRDEG